MMAYALENGRKRWDKKDKNAYHSKPIVFENTLIYGDVEGRVYARDTATGTLHYSVDLGASVESQPLIHQGRLFFHTRNHQIFSLDARTGKILWSYKRNIAQSTTLQRTSRPTVYNNKLFVGFADGHICSLSIEEGMLLWERKISSGEKFIDVDMGPVFFNDRLYIGSLSGNLHVFNPQTGAVLKIFQDQIGRSPTIIDQNLVYLNTKGEVVVLNHQEQEIKRFKLSKEDFIGSITTWKGGIVVTSIKGNLYFIDKKTYQVLETISLGHTYSAVFGTPAVTRDYMAVLSSRNRLYVYQ